MTMFCLNIKNIRRAQGRSSVGAAAYCARERLQDERTSYSYDFLALPGCFRSAVFLPEQFSAEWRSRSVLWNANEARSAPDKATLALEIEGAVPGELSGEEAWAAARAFVEVELVRREFAVDLSVHCAGDVDDVRRWWVHALVPVGGYENTWLWPDRLRQWRKRWAETVNARVMAAGLPGAFISPGPGGARGRCLDLDDGIDGPAAVELRWRNGERLNAEPELAVRLLLRSRDGFTREELADLIRRLTGGEAQFKKVLRRVESLPGLIRRGKSAAGDDLFGFRAAPAGGAQNLPAAAPDREDVPPPAMPGEMPLPGAEDEFAALRAAAAEWERAGLRVRGMALTSGASKSFEKAAGIRTVTVRGMLGCWKRKDSLLTPRDVLVVNDAEQLSDRQKEWMVKAVRRARAKMAVVTGRSFVLIDGTGVGLDEAQSAALGWSGA